MDDNQIAIKQALIQTLQQTDFEHLSIEDILKNSKVDLNTFYNQFPDKYALLDFYETKVADGIRELIIKNISLTLTFQAVDEAEFQYYPSLKLVVKYIYTNFDLMSVLLGPNSDHKLEPILKSILAELINSDLKRIKGQLTEQLPHDYAVVIIVSDFFAIVKHWLGQKQPDQPEVIIDIIEKTRSLSANNILMLTTKF